MSPRLPKVREAIELATADSSNITQNQIQSAFELRLECMDSDLRTIHSGVCKLPSPVRSCVYSDPGNRLLAENLKKNVKYIARLLSCNIEYKHQPPKSVGIARKSTTSPRIKSTTVPDITIDRSPSSDSASIAQLIDMETGSLRPRSSAMSQSTVLSGVRRSRAPSSRAGSTPSDQGSSPRTGRKKVRPQTVNCARDLQHSRCSNKMTRVKSASPASAVMIRKCSFSDFGRPLPISYNKFLADSVAHPYNSRAPFLR